MVVYLISWQSKVQRVIALLTTKAEYMAATEAGREVIWIHGLLAEIGLPVTKTTLYGDNTGSNALTKNPEFHQRTKHVELRQRFITSLVTDKIVTDKIVEVEYISSNAMLFVERKTYPALGNDF